MNTDESFKSWGGPSECRMTTNAQKPDVERKPHSRRIPPNVVNGLPAMPGYRVHECPVCEHRFLTRNTKQIYCSRACYKLTLRRKTNVI